MFKNHTSCRVCGNPDLKRYLDLGLMPLSNNLLNDPDDVAPRYPLQVQLCERCGLSQLSVVIDPQTLFGHYVYRSSISQGYRTHCKRMAEDLKERFGLGPDSFHIDIAGNDGALLAEFKKVMGPSYKTLSVDPAANLAQICEDQGIRAYRTFWGMGAAQHLLSTSWPLADLITATNVFAHVDNVAEFLEAAKAVLAPKGVLILEFPYLIDFITKKEFDTVYFEHLSYFSVAPLAFLCDKVGLNLVDVQYVDIHGGSIRCYIGRQPKDVTGRVGVYIDHELERGYHRIDTYKAWAASVAQTVDDFTALLKALRGSKVYGFAASAKGNTLLNYAGVTVKQIPVIIDQTPEKIGKYSPGTGIPIAGMDRLLTDKPDYLVLLSWNFADEIVHKCRAAGFTGKFIHPLTSNIFV